MSKSIVFTHTDIDGAVSYSVLCWFKQNKLPVKPISQADFKTFCKTSLTNKISEFDKIYVLDLNVGDCVQCLDHPNVTIVDHHAESIEAAAAFKSAKVFCSDSTSTAMLLYKTLKNFNKKDFLTTKQKIILLMADDYEQYTFKISSTRDLNNLFWSYQGDRVSKFYEEFKDGFTKFSEQQKNIINFYKKRVNSTIQDLKLYNTVLDIKDKKYNITSTFADFGINDVAEHVLKTVNTDIVIVINLKSERVSYRKNKNCDVKLNKLAKLLSDGGGHEDAAGGILNDTFINFSKSFNEYELCKHKQDGNGPFA